MKAYEKKIVPMVIGPSPFHFLTHTGNERKNLIGFCEEHTILWPFLFFVLSHGDYCTTGLAFHLNFKKNPGMTDRHGNEKYRGVIVQQNHYGGSSDVRMQK